MFVQNNIIWYTPVSTIKSSWVYRFTNVTLSVIVIFVNAELNVFVNHTLKKTI